MAKFSKEYLGVKYEVDYEYEIDTFRNFIVNVTKFSYKKLQNFNEKNLLNRFQIVVLIENQLAMPEV